MGRVENPIRVEVAWSPRAGEVTLLTLSLPHGATIAEAIAEAIAQGGRALPEGVVSGVWGRVREASHILCDGDRLELLRPLAVDPMEARRRRQRVARQPAR